MKISPFKHLIFFILNLFTITTFAQNWIQRGQYINGTGAYEFMGSSARISGDGSIIVVGAGSGDSNYVKAFELDNVSRQWVQKGSKFYGDKSGDHFGKSVDVSQNGNTFIAGANGYVKVYFWNGHDWEQRGANITNASGNNVDISDDGGVIAVGNNKLYYWSGYEWLQKGQDISAGVLNSDGSVGAAAGAVYDYVGDTWVKRGNFTGDAPVSLSADGNRIASKKSNSQVVFIMEWDGAQWNLMGDSIKAPDPYNEFFGSTITMTRDGNSVAIADFYGGTLYNGAVYVYDWNGTSWVKRAQNIYGSAADGDLGAYRMSVGISDNGRYVVAGAPYVASITTEEFGRVENHTWCPGTQYHDTVIACGTSYTWPVNSKTYSTAGTYKDTLVDPDGCNEYYNLVLSFADTALVDTTVFLCDNSNYIWKASGLTYTKDGTYIDTLSGSGCPAIYTMHFKKGLNDTTNQSLTACNTYYLWPANDQFYTSSGNYQTILTNQYGCKSVQNLDLIIYPVPDVEDTVYSCTSTYTWSVNGKSYSTEGIYKDTTSSLVTGCDSINTLNLFFQKTALDTTTSIYGSFISPYTYTQYTTTGIYTENLNLNGCAVTYTIDLNVKMSGPLHGTYTIDQTGAGDFTSFSDAVQALGILGVDGAVTFDVKEDTYDETFSLDSIPGSSEVNTVTFLGENTNVIMTPSSIPNQSQFILLNQISNIRFDSIQFIHKANVTVNMIVINGPASNFSAENCVFSFDYDEKIYDYFQGITATSISDITVRNNDFSGGTTSLSADNCDSIIFESNYTNGILIRNSTDIAINKNEFNVSGYGYGLSLSQSDNFSITDNKINPGYPTYGTVYIYYNNPVTTPSKPSVISNNFIFTPNALVIKTMDSLSFFYNTIVSDKGALDLKMNSGSAPVAFNSKIKNNILVAGSGDVITTDNEFENVEIDYNLYYTPDSGKFISYGLTGSSSTEEYASLSDWQAAYPANDAHSRFFKPVFAGPSDLHITSDTDYRFGDPSVGISFDIDGDPRSLTGPVDVGADQFSGTITGTYVNTKSGSASLNAYPVPVNNILNFSIDRELTSWEIVSLQGVVIKQSEKGNTSGKGTIPTGEIENGMYILKVTDWDGQVIAVKFVKK